MAVALLANALRKEGVLRGREERAGASPVLAAGAGRRAESARQYARGMRDLLAVLFADGGPVADECVEAARRRRERGSSPGGAGARSRRRPRPGRTSGSRRRPRRGG